jgi:hypothetical protein
MLENIQQILHLYDETDFLEHFSTDRAGNLLPQVNLAPWHNPLTLKRGDIAPGQKDVPIVVDNHSNHRGYHVIFLEFGFGFWHEAPQRSSQFGEARNIIPY